MKRLVLGMCLAGAMTGAVAAAAGTYDVYSCWAGAGSYLNPNASAAAWVQDASRATLGGGTWYYRAFDGCASAEGAFGTASIPAGQAPNGVYAESRFASPDGTDISRVQLWRAAYDYGTGSGASAHRSYLTDLADALPFGRGDVFQGGANAAAGTAGSGDTAAHGIAPGNYLDLDLSDRLPDDFSVRIGCALAPCPTVGHYPGRPSAPDTEARIFGAIVTVRDNQEPTMVVEKTGLLADGTHSGVEPVVIRLAADEAGIKRIAVYADSIADPVGLADFERDQNHCSWWAKRPCQPVKDLSLPVDTRAVANGRHTFTVRAFDAAGNTRDHPATDVLVANGQAGGGSGGGASGGGTPTRAGGGTTRNSGGGSTRSGGNSESSRGSGGLGEFFPSARDPLNGLHASEHARMTATFVRNGRTHLRTRYGSRPRIRGRLLNRRRHPIADAQVIVQGRRPGSRARWVDLGSARTHKSGRFTFRLPRDANSLELRVVYRFHLSGDGVVVARKLVVRVEWSVHLHVAPRSVHNGQSISFQGLLDAGPVRRAEKLVDMQVRIDRRWRTFATTRAAADGTFQYRYRFRRTFRSVTYSFRALSRYEVGFPYSSGASSAVRVRVR